MIILKEQGIIFLVVSYLADVCLTTKLLTEKNLIKFKREKRNAANDELKDQIFKRIEVLECTVTMATITSTSNLRYKINIYYFPKKIMHFLLIHKEVYLIFLILEQKWNVPLFVFQWIIVTHFIGKDLTIDVRYWKKETCALIRKILIQL